MQIGSYSPRQWAYDQLITSARRIHQEITRYNSIDGENLTPRQGKEAAKQVAKLHNSLLEKSGLDGLPLEVS